jgi:very-short-patch-repair endonuclease
MPNQNSHITKIVNLNIKQIEKMLIEGFSVSEISKSLSLPYAAIYNGIRRHNMSHFVSVSKNGKSKTSKQYHDRIQKFDYDTLKEEYIDNKLNLYEIADKYDMSASSVFLYMKKLGVDTRSKRDASLLMYEKKPEIKDILRQLAFDGVTGIHNKNFNRRETSIERSFEKFCQENNISFIKQYQINGEGHRYDFLVLDKLLIELDGVFWHSTDKQKMLDEEYNKLAIQHGYDIIRFTDIEIKKTKGKCFDAVRKFI